MSESARFAPVDSKVFTADNLESKKTKDTTSFAVGVLREFCVEKNLSADIAGMSTDDLAGFSQKKSYGSHCD